MHIITLSAGGSVAATDEKRVKSRVSVDEAPACSGSAPRSTDAIPLERIDRRLDERAPDDGRVWIRRKKTTNLIGAIHPLLRPANSDSGGPVEAINQANDERTQDNESPLNSKPCRSRSCLPLHQYTTEGRAPRIYSGDRQ